MKHIQLIFLSAIFPIQVIFCQNALTASIGLVSGHKELNYTTVFGTRENHYQVRMQQSPYFNLYWMKPLGERKGLEVGLHGMHYHSFDNYYVVDNSSIGFGSYINGSKKVQAGGGIHFGQFRKLGLLTGRNSLFLSFYVDIDHFYASDTPTTSLDAPFTLNESKVGLGSGLRYHWEFGPAGFLSVAMPFTFYELGMDIFKVRDNFFSGKEQQQIAFSHDLVFWKRLKIELGVGVFIGINKKPFHQEGPRCKPESGL